MASPYSQDDVDRAYRLNWGMEKRRPTDVLVGVGLRLKALRQVKGLSQQGLGDILGASEKTVSAWEKGTRLFNVLLAIKLVDDYGVTLDFFYLGTLAGVRGELLGDLRSELTALERERPKARPFRPAISYPSQPKRTPPAKVKKKLNAAVRRHSRLRHKPLILA